MAEAMSEVTCEQCGAPGEERGGGWIVTLCDTHAGERKGKFGAVTAVELFDDPS